MCVHTHTHTLKSWCKNARLNPKVSTQSSSCPVTEWIESRTYIQNIRANK